jgi:hypothetical protein
MQDLHAKLRVRRANGLAIGGGRVHILSVGGRQRSGLWHVRLC